MKFKKLYTVSLVAILGASLAGGSTVFAAADALAGKGEVEVEEGTTDPTDPIPDPEIPGGEITDPTEPGITTNPNGGSLAVQHVSVLDFGRIKTSSTEVTSYAKEIKWTDSSSVEHKRGALVVFSDIRAGGVYGYDLQAKMTKQFTKGSDVLTNASIKYNSAAVDAVEGNTNVVPSTVTSSFELKLDQAVTAVTADKTNKEGKGQYTLEYGRSDDYSGANGTAGTADTSVQLVIPSATASSMAIGNYEAEVTWTLIAK